MTIRSAIYVTGNKFKIWDTIKPHLQGDTRTELVDLFTGSGTIILNSVNEGLFKQYHGNDNLEQLVAIHKYLQDNKDFKTLSLLNASFPDGEDSYYKMREMQWNNHCPELDLLLHFRSNTNYLRWNSSGGFNVPYGKREYYNEGKLLKHSLLVRNNVEFTCKDYTTVCEDLLKRDDLNKTTVYIDCPYLKTTTMYTGGWSWMDDDNLRMYCKKLASLGAKVVYSNVLVNRDFVNEELKKWVDDNKEQFTLYHLDRDYSNSSFRKSSIKSDEVLIVSNN